MVTLTVTPSLDLALGMLHPTTKPFEVFPLGCSLVVIKVKAEALCHDPGCPTLSFRSHLGTPLSAPPMGARGGPGRHTHCSPGPCGKAFDSDELTSQRPACCLGNKASVALRQPGQGQHQVEQGAFTWVHLSVEHFLLGLNSQSYDQNSVHASVCVCKALPP